MALQLMKINVAAATAIETNPVYEKFFHVTTDEVAAGTTLTLDTADFFDDTGAEATELPELAENNSYFNVNLNGVLQMNGITAYTPGAPGTGSLAITVPEGDEPILAGTPVVLEVVNFETSSTTTVST